MNASEQLVAAAVQRAPEEGTQASLRMSTAADLPCATAGGVVYLEANRAGSAADLDHGAVRRRRQLKHAGVGRALAVHRR